MLTGVAQMVVGGVDIGIAAALLGVAGRNRRRRPRTAQLGL
jgi:hypothetical protein